MLLLLAWGAQAYPASHAVVFMYHRFGEDTYPSTSVKLEQFDAHLDYLANNDFHVWPLARVVTHLQEGRALPDKTVVLTIDDGYRTVYTEAFPRLKARSWPFTVFVSTDAVDKGLAGFMTWEQMREMQKHGASFANHTATHDYLLQRGAGENIAAWEKRVRADIIKGQARLQAELGVDVNEAPRLFAYPYGEYNMTLANMLLEMRYIAFGQHSGAIGLPFDPRSLPRFPMAENYAQRNEFALKATTLSLPVIEGKPWDPTTANEQNPPRLIVRLEQSDANLNELACYFGGARMTVQWLDEARNTFAVQADTPLSGRRSRYNCTAPQRDGGRYYWYSQLWIRTGEN